MDAARPSASVAKVAADDCCCGLFTSTLASTNGSLSNGDFSKEVAADTVNGRVPVVGGGKELLPVVFCNSGLLLLLFISCPRFVDNSGVDKVTLDSESGAIDDRVVTAGVVDVVDNVAGVVIVVATGLWFLVGFGRPKRLIGVFLDGFEAPPPIAPPPIPA